jgi:hypothetical protein
MAQTFYSTYLQFLEGVTSTPQYWVAQVNADGAFYNVTMTYETSTLVMRDAALSAGTTPATMANFVASWEGPNAGIQLGADFVACTNLSMADNAIQMMTTVFNGLLTMAESTIDYHSQGQESFIYTPGSVGVYARVLAATIYATTGNTAYMVLASFSGSYPGAAYQGVGGGFLIGQSQPRVTQDIQAVLNNRRSIAAQTQPTMSATPGQDPPVDNGGLFVLFGNPSSVSFVEAAEAGWTDVADADVDIQDSQATLTIVGRCLTGKET